VPLQNLSWMKFLRLYEISIRVRSKMHKPRRDARQVEGDHIYIAFDTKKEKVITNPPSGIQHKTFIKNSLP